MVTAFAPGKCILFGEHAVVYGHPAVAVAIDAGVEVELTESDSWTIEGMPFQSEKHPHISHILNDIFIMLNPFMPHITEELWHVLNNHYQNKLLSLQV